MKKKTIKIISMLFLVIFVLTTASFAQAEAFTLEKSEEFKKWESLSQEEKEKVIQPSFYSISIKDSMRRSLYNKYLLRSTPLQSVYNLSEIYNMIVKDQKMTGTCWSNAATTMIENNMAVRKKLLGQEYSPFHMDYFASKMYNKKVGDGGNATMMTAYLANGYGPVLESDFPMESVYDEENNSPSQYYLTDIDKVDLNKTAQLKLNKTINLPTIYKEYDPTTGEIIYHDGIDENIYTAEQVEAVRKSIKTHIRDYGAVIATMYIDVAINEGGEFISDYYDNQTNIFCCTENSRDTTSNHQVTIVGWDDNKKAYIVQNSYGEAFGDNGYFYISYDDVRIEEYISGVKDLEQLTEDSYDNIYKYDELGMSQAITFGEKESYYANVFNRETNITEQEEYINEVGLYISNTSGIEIYVNSKDGEFDESKLKLVSSGEILEPGYHVIKLNASEDTRLTGEQFIIAVKSINQEDAYIPIECNLYESKFTFSSNFFDKATANEGESFFSLDGKEWYEINGLKVGWTTTLKNTNVCVRAFSQYKDRVPQTVEVTGVQLDKDSITLTEGQTGSLIATVLPENATNKNVTWASSDESIATVSDGVVTGIKAGKATITVKTVDGNYTATAQITVKAKTVNVTGVTLNKSTYKLEIGETYTLIATVSPENATNKNVTWTSSDESIATVSGGVVTGVKAGKATITVKTIDGNHTATAQITVEEKTVNVTGVTLNKISETLKIGETCSLIATVLPENATNKNVNWTSSDESIATVKNGVVTGVKAGKTTITVKTVDGNYTATAQITVEENKPAKIDVTSVALNKRTEKIKIGETCTLVATVLPENATNKNVTWASSDESVATVSSGVVTGAKAGNVTITVKTVDGNHTATAQITVEEKTVNVTGVTLNKNSETLKTGETCTLIATVLPENATNKNVTWTSSDEKVATVSGGVVTGVKAGKATITVKTVDGNYTATAQINVEEEKINVTGVTLNKNTQSLKIGETCTLIATVLPENATNKNVNWTSSDESVATVVGGVVTALKEGTTTITVKTNDGSFTSNCKITVSKSENIKVESIKLNKSEIQLEVSDKETLIVKFNPERPTNTNIKWESSNTKVVTVDQNGIVTAVKKGNAVITATSEDGGHIAKCKVTVTKEVEDPDDIYKEQEKDTTTSTNPFPNAGIHTAIFSIAIIVLIIMGYSSIKYRKLKDVK